MEVIINYEKNSSCFIDVPCRFIVFPKSFDDIFHGVPDDVTLNGLKWN